MAWIRTGLAVDEETWQRAREHAVKSRQKLQDFVNEALRQALALPTPPLLVETETEYDRIEADPIYGPMLKALVKAYRASR